MCSVQVGVDEVKLALDLVAGFALRNELLTPTGQGCSGLCDVEQVACKAVKATVIRQSLVSAGMALC